MLWLWLLLPALAALAGLRTLLRLRAERAAAIRPPRLDDDAIRRILETGSLEWDDPDPLDMDAAARAEREFWSETWDEPEEYQR